MKSSKIIINFNVANLVKAKFVSQLQVGDWVNTSQTKKSRPEQITKIEVSQSNEKILNLTTESGVYQATLGSIVIP